MHSISKRDLARKGENFTIEFSPPYIVRTYEIVREILTDVDVIGERKPLQQKEEHQLLSMADLAGLEPTTRCLEGSCSVQMSYRSISSLLQIISKIRGSFYIKNQGLVSLPGDKNGQGSSS